MADVANALLRTIAEIQAQVDEENARSPNRSHQWTLAAAQET